MGQGRKMCIRDRDSARKVAGNGFYYLMGDIARLHSAVLAYARDFMIDRGFTYCVPPFMIRSNVVTGVMSFAEMDAKMCIRDRSSSLPEDVQHAMYSSVAGLEHVKIAVSYTHLSLRLFWAG